MVATAVVSAAVAGHTRLLFLPFCFACPSLFFQLYIYPVLIRSFALCSYPSIGGGGESRACAVPTRRASQTGKGKIATAYPPPTAACSPARLFAYSLASCFAKKSDHPLACTTCPISLTCLLSLSKRVRESLRLWTRPDSTRITITITRVTWRAPSSSVRRLVSRASERTRACQ